MRVRSPDSGSIEVNELILVETFLELNFCRKLLAVYVPTLNE